jgi:hypothetical protein
MQQWRNICGIALLTALIAGLAHPALGQTRLAVPSYQNPGTTVWNGWAASGPAAVGIMVVSLNHGDDQTYHASIASAIQRAQLKGIYVLGYTYTSYGTRDPKVIRQRIDSLYNNYLVDGIFLTRLLPTAAPKVVSSRRAFSIIRNLLTMFVKNTWARALPS